MSTWHELVLPTDAEIKAALWAYAHSDLETDAIQMLYSDAIDKNKPNSEDEYDELFDAVAERFYEVLR